jgi:hypothetical protein
MFVIIMEKWMPPRKLILHETSLTLHSGKSTVL